MVDRRDRFISAFFSGIQPINSRQPGAAKSHEIATNYQLFLTFTVSSRSFVRPPASSSFYQA